MAGRAPVGSGNCPSSCPSCPQHSQLPQQAAQLLLPCHSRHPDTDPSSAPDIHNIPSSTMSTGVCLLLGLLILRAEPSVTPEKDGEYQESNPAAARHRQPLGAAPCILAPASLLCPLWDHVPAGCSPCTAALLPEGPCPTPGCRSACPQPRGHPLHPTGTATISSQRCQ